MIQDNFFTILTNALAFTQTLLKLTEEDNQQAHKFFLALPNMTETILIDHSQKTRKARFKKLFAAVGNIFQSLPTFGFITSNKKTALLIKEEQPGSALL